MRVFYLFVFVLSFCFFLFLCLCLFYVVICIYVFLVDLLVLLLVLFSSWFVLCALCKLVFSFFILRRPRRLLICWSDGHLLYDCLFVRYLCLLCLFVFVFFFVFFLLFTLLLCCCLRCCLLILPLFVLLFICVVCRLVYRSFGVLLTLLSRTRLRVFSTARCVTPWNRLISVSCCLFSILFLFLYLFPFFFPLFVCSFLSIYVSSFVSFMFSAFPFCFVCFCGCISLVSLCCLFVFSRDLISLHYVN